MLRTAPRCAPEDGCRARVSVAGRRFVAAWAGGIVASVSVSLGSGVCGVCGVSEGVWDGSLMMDTSPEQEISSVSYLPLPCLGRKGNQAAQAAIVAVGP